jgi:2-polyprenyl-3-methyl-5-hydroxy-6-metoxy-1,4-benzoquinol methylase
MVGRSVCKVCSTAALQEVAEFQSLPRVTSDCVPFRAGGRLLVCRNCNAAQSPADDQWFAEIHEIYEHYYAYRQAGGVEQSVSDSSGELRRRSEVLLTNLLASSEFPSGGKALDVGCGTGATLRALSNRGGWRLYGLEIDDKHLHRLKRIRGFEALYTCAPGEVPGQFDLVTMVHALEHFPDPVATLRDLSSKVAKDGCLFVEVPNAEANPFDYVIADHMMHFTPSSLSNLAARADFEIKCLSTNWIPKELSMTARPSANPGAFVERSINRLPARDYLLTQINWLRRFIDTAAQAMANSATFGLFGTAIAATWLCSILGDRVAFFVEEDASRIGHLHMGRPVISPAQLQPESTVYIALIPEIAGQIASRLQRDSITISLPPPLAQLGAC